MDKFLELINNEAEKLANAYFNADIIGREDILQGIDIRLSILAHAQALKTSCLTADFTKIMEDRMKDIDFSKVDFNDLVKQMGDLNGKV